MRMQPSDRFATPTPLAEGVLIADRYRLDRLLGEGGMGSVWAATHLETGERHALKFLKDFDVDKPDRQRRFLREARAAMAIRHPSVVKIHEAFAPEDPSTSRTPSFIAMDLLVGEQLGDRITRRGSFSLRELARILLPVVSAVGTAHAMGIVHRDLKPENIFLCTGRSEGGTERGELEVKVLDFGIAKLTAVEGAMAMTEGLTQSGDRLGTPRYMSPEQIYGDSDIDHRTDIWSLGIIFYECLAGFHPIRGENIGQFFKAITSQTIPPIESFVPELPNEIADLVRRMLERDRRKRPSDLRDVFDALRAHSDVAVQKFEAPPVRSSEPRTSATTLDDSIDERASTRPPEQPRRSFPWFPAVALGTLFVAGGAYWMRQREVTPSASVAPPTNPSNSVSAPSSSASVPLPTASVSSSASASAVPSSAKTFVAPSASP